MYGGMYQIGVDDYIVLNGNHMGSVWCAMDNGKIYKKSPDFNHYVKTPLITFITYCASNDKTGPLRQPTTH